MTSSKFGNCCLRLLQICRSCLLREIFNPIRHACLRMNYIFIEYEYDIFRKYFPIFSSKISLQCFLSMVPLELRVISTKLALKNAKMATENQASSRPRWKIISGEKIIINYFALISFQPMGGVYCFYAVASINSVLLCFKLMLDSTCWCFLKKIT